MGDVLGVLRQIPLQMTGEPRAIIEHAEQDWRPPLATRGEHLLRSMVTVPVPQTVDVGGLEAAYLAIQQTRLGALGAFGPPRGEPSPLAEPVRLEEAAQRRIRRHRAKLRMFGGERVQVVVMQPGAPALVRGVLRQHGRAQRRADGGLPAGVGAQLAAQYTDRIVPLPTRPVVPALDRGDAETDRLAGDRM